MKKQVLSTVFWLSASCLGLWVLLRYQVAPGAEGVSPERWPADCGIPRLSGQPSLLVFAHPQCPCTRASIDELAWIMSRAQGKALAHVLVFKPEGMPENWEKTDLWRTAASIPGVQVSVDLNGDQARQFGSFTSGQTLLYDGSGRLLFSGGITRARGHSGANAGRNAVLSLLLERKGEHETPVFGCALFASHSRSGGKLQRLLNQIGG